jgi:4-amino-4-deoxy-L-arabinose transferase-like glycosyltransferase
LNALALILVLGLTALMGLRVLGSIRAHRAYPPDYDEAVHILPVLQIASDLRRLDLAAFWVHTYTQDQIGAYPFLHSWLTAPFFLLGPPTLTTGRTASLVFLSLAILVGFFLARELAPDRTWRWLAGLVGGGMMVAAMPLWTHAGLVYLEAAGLLVTLGALFCYAKATSERDARSWLVATSLCAAAALFTKYQYGLFVLGGMALSEVVELALTRRLRLRRWLYLFGPCTALALFWFADLDKLHRFWGYAHAQAPSPGLSDVERLLFYPRSLVRHYVSGPVSLGLMLLGIGLGSWQICQHRYRAVLGYLLTSLVIVSFVPQKGVGFAYTIAPAGLVLGGTAAAWLAAQAVKRARSSLARLGMAILIVVLLGVEGRAVAHRFSFLEAAQEILYTCTPDTGRAYQFILDRTLVRGVRPYILNPWHQFGHYALTWEYYAESARLPATVDFHLTAAGMAAEPTLENLDRLLQSVVSQGAGILVSIDGSPAGAYTGWQVIEPLWARGDVEWIASSEPYTLVAWPESYKDRVYGGDFASAAEFEAVRRANRGEFQIQLHLYAVRAGR